MFTVTEITPHFEAVSHDPFIDGFGERRGPASGTLDRPIRTVADLRLRLGKAA